MKLNKKNLAKNAHQKINKQIKIIFGYKKNYNKKIEQNKKYLVQKKSPFDNKVRK